MVVAQQEINVTGTTWNEEQTGVLKAGGVHGAANQHNPRMSAPANQDSTTIGYGAGNGKWNRQRTAKCVQQQ